MMIKGFFSSVLHKNTYCGYSLGKKNMCVFQVLALKKIRYLRSALTFYFILIFYM